MLLATVAVGIVGSPVVEVFAEGAVLIDPAIGAASGLYLEALFERLRDSGAQVWLTGTELAPFDAIAGEAAVWRVSGGAVERLS